MDPILSPTRLSRQELEAESAAALPAKEVLSVPLLDLNVDLDLALALAAPIDLAVAANANAALPIDASVSANVLSEGSTSNALAPQGTMIDQLISGQALAEGHQASTIDQTDTTGDAGTGADTGDDGSADTGADGTSADVATGDAVQDVGDVVAGGLLQVDANVSLDADLAAPIAGAVAANANVAAPIDAAVSANIASVDSDSVALADQTALITQHMDDVTASATVDQTSGIDQADTSGALTGGDTADSAGTAAADTADTAGTADAAGDTDAADTGGD